MIKKLQRRFIVIAVCAVVAVLAVIMGSICISNYFEVTSEADKTIAILEENNGNYPIPDNPGKTSSNNGDKGGGKSVGVLGSNLRQDTSPEAPFETRFFTAFLNENGEVTGVNTGSIAAVATDEAIEYAGQAYSSGRTKGFMGVYRYSVTETDTGTMIVFLDCSRGLNLFYKFMEASLGVSLIGILGVFVIVLLLSKKAIKPIADSYEKQKHFITDASHELKTPLTVINANTEVLEMTQGESEWTRSIRNQVERLTELTNSLVSLARMDEHGKILMTDFSISDAVSESLEPLAILASQKGRSIETNIRENISYKGNEAEIRKLVGILADNAIKYSSENGSIVITLKENSKGPLLTVTNTADGLTRGNHDEMFERFYRGDSSHSSEIGGFGIGLSIARAITGAHKGKISARSDDGKSLTISVQL